jgi:hypothetical protein
MLGFLTGRGDNNFMPKKKEYQNLGIDCANSKWPVSWLFEKNNNSELCECPFECKLKIFHIKTGQEFFIGKKEYNSLVKSRKLQKI